MRVIAIWSAGILARHCDSGTGPPGSGPALRFWARSAGLRPGIAILGPPGSGPALRFCGSPLTVAAHKFHSQIGLSQKLRLVCGSVFYHVH